MMITMLVDLIITVVIQLIVYRHHIFGNVLVHVQIQLMYLHIVQQALLSIFLYPLKKLVCETNKLCDTVTVKKEQEKLCA